MKISKIFFALLGAVFVVCLIAGFHFAFRVIGYEILAVMFFGIDFLILIYFALWLLGRKQKKLARRLRIITNCLLLIGIIYFSVLEILAITNSFTDAPREVDYVIILGAGVMGKTPTVALWNRLVTAEEYLKNNPKTKVVCSGGQGKYEEITEAECMYIWLTEQGISPERIIKEDKSTNTNQNISNSLKLIKADTKSADPSIALVSNEFHIFRAKLTAKLYGVTRPYGIAAKSSLLQLMVNGYIREAFSLTKLWALGT